VQRETEQASSAPLTAPSPNLFQRSSGPEIVPELEGSAAQTPAGLLDFWPPSDDHYRFAWHLDDDYSQLRAARTRVGDPGSARIRIGILDTGYDPDHVTVPLHLNRGLAGNLVEADQPTVATDRPVGGLLESEGHGTATLAILAGNRVAHPSLPGGSDWLGAAPFLEVIPVRVADSVMHFSSDALADGIDHAVARGCRVVSISMGGVPTARWAQAVNNAYEHGVVVVAAAGNRFGPSPPWGLVYPARFHRVIAVCGATFDKTPYYRDEPHRQMQGVFGPASRMETALAAYTPNIPWAVMGTSTEISPAGSGTSAATPQVAAAAALWLQLHHPDRPHSEGWKVVEACRRALFSTADDRSRTHFGNGLLRAADALDVPYDEAGLRPSPEATVRFRWLRLLGVLETVPAEEPSATDQLWENEALCLYLESQRLQGLAGGADPDDALSGDQIRAVLSAMTEEPRISQSLRQRLQLMLAGP
jgi:subtilisin family serine protease